MTQAAYSGWFTVNVRSKMKAPLGIYALTLVCLALLVIPLLFWVLSDDHSFGDYTGSIPKEKIPSILSELKERSGLVDLPASAKNVQIWTLRSYFHTSSLLIRFEIEEAEFDIWCRKLPRSFKKTNEPIWLDFPQYSEHGADYPPGNYYGMNKQTKLALIQLNFN